MFGLRWLQIFLGEWFWMVFYGFGCLEMVLGDSGGFLRFAVLVATVESVDLNLKEVDNRGKFL